MFGSEESYDRAENVPADEAEQDAPSEGAAAQTSAAPAPTEAPRSRAGAPAPPRPEPTGDDRVDAALARFDELAAAPVADHVEIFEDVQQSLQDVLASIDHEGDPAVGDPAGDPAVGDPAGDPAVGDPAGDPAVGDHDSGADVDHVGERVQGREDGWS